MSITNQLTQFQPSAKEIINAVDDTPEGIKLFETWRRNPDFWTKIYTRKFLLHTMRHGNTFLTSHLVTFLDKKQLSCLDKEGNTIFDHAFDKLARCKKTEKINKIIECINIVLHSGIDINTCNWKHLMPVEELCDRHENYELDKDEKWIKSLIKLFIKAGIQYRFFGAEEIEQNRLEKKIFYRTLKEMEMEMNSKARLELHLCNEYATDRSLQLPAEVVNIIAQHYFPSLIKRVISSGKGVDDIHMFIT